MKYLWTAITVKNLDDSIAFYTGLLDLRVLSRFPAGPTTEIAFLGNGDEGETRLELLVDCTKSEVSFGESISVDFAVDSLAAMLEAAAAKNIPVHGGPFETPKMRYFCVKDPNGLRVQFFQQK